ncbi:MAG: hypothetical protein QXX38_02185 [Candidatus Aenigmatarchaeota archaeon]
MNGNKNEEQIRFIEEQLFEATHALFNETSVKRIKFLQNKIDYLKKMRKELMKQ